MNTPVVLPDELRTPEGQAALHEVLHRVGVLTDAALWYGYFDRELGRVCLVSHELEDIADRVKKFNEEDVHFGGHGGAEVRTYTLIELVAALVDATSLRMLDVCPHG
jgi:hypothetical protein